MFRLSRQVRFAVDPRAREAPGARGHNGFAGKPPVAAMGQCFYTLSVTLAGATDAATGYLTNIKRIDEAVRERALPLVQQSVGAGCQGDHHGGGGLVLGCFDALADAFDTLRLDAVVLHLSPFLSLTATAGAGRNPHPMILLSHTFEFAASHRLHNPALGDEENRRIFGKCNNPHGHGHNYTLKVTLAGEPDRNGFLMDLNELERIVDEAVIGPLDHKHLNVEVADFTELIPSVENIAKVIFTWLDAPIRSAGATLDSVTVWETPKTWCEYRPASI